MTEWQTGLVMLATRPTPPAEEPECVRRPYDDKRVAAVQANGAIRRTRTANIALGVVCAHPQGIATSDLSVVMCCSITTTQKTMQELHGRKLVRRTKAGSSFVLHPLDATEPHAPDRCACGGVWKRHSDSPKGGERLRCSACSAFITVRDDVMVIGVVPRVRDFHAPKTERRAIALQTDRPAAHQ